MKKGRYLFRSSFVDYLLPILGILLDLVCFGVPYNIVVLGRKIYMTFFIKGATY